VTRILPGYGERVTLALRAATAADLAAVGSLHARSRDRAYAGLVPADALRAVPAAALAQWWTQRWAYERDSHALTVATDGDAAVLGFSYVGPSRTRRAAELYAIHVDPDRQGTGVGRALMIDALGRLGRYGQPTAVLWVLSANAPARQFYEAGGWCCDGVTRRAPLGPAVTRQLRYSRALPAA